MNRDYVSYQRTVCEVTREIYDILDNIKSKITIDEYNSIADRLNEQFTMQKKMNKKLYEYNKEYDKEFWIKNPNYEKSLLSRLNIDEVEARKMKLAKDEKFKHYKTVEEREYEKYKNNLKKKLRSQK